MSAALLVLCAAVAHAQEVPTPPPLAADAVRVDAFGARTTVVPSTVGFSGFRSSLAAVHLRDPLVFRPSTGEAPVAIVGPVWGVYGALARAVGPAAFAVSLPVYAAVGSDLSPEGSLPGPGSALGDAALDARFIGRDASEDGGLGLAGQGRLTAPLGGDAVYLGQPGWSWELLLTGELQRAQTAVVAALGTRGVPAVAVDGAPLDDLLLYRASVQQAFGAGGVSVELLGQRQYQGFFDDPTNSPLEVLVGGWSSRQEDRRLRGAVGLGLNAGIGAPQLRAVLGVGADAQQSSAAR